MSDRGDSARGAADGDRAVATFFCRDCRAYFQAEPTGDEGQSAECPHCRSVSFTVEFEQEARRRATESARVFSVFGDVAHLATGGLFKLFFPDPGGVEDLPPNPFERRPPRFSRSSQIGQLVETCLRGSTLQQLDTDRQVWEFYLWRNGKAATGPLLEDVNLLLAMPPREAFDAVNALCFCEGQTFIYPPSELVAWLEELKEFLEQVIEDGRA